MLLNLANIITRHKTQDCIGYIKFDYIRPSNGPNCIANIPHILLGMDNNYKNHS